MDDNQKCLCDSLIETLRNSLANSDNIERIQQSNIEYSLTTFTEHWTQYFTFTIFKFREKCMYNIREVNQSIFIRYFQTLLLFSQDADKQTFNLFLAVLQRFGLLFNGGSRRVFFAFLFIEQFVCFYLDIQWLKNHVDIVEDFANFLIQVNFSFDN